MGWIQINNPLLSPRVIVSVSGDGVVDVQKNFTFDIVSNPVFENTYIKLNKNNKNYYIQQIKKLKNE